MQTKRKWHGDIRKPLATRINFLSACSQLFKYLDNRLKISQCRTLELERFVEKLTRNADIFSLYLFYVVKTTTRLEIGLSCFRFVVFVVVCIVQLLLLCLVFPSGYLVHINMAGQTPT